jgi:hypothetical protein
MDTTKHESHGAVAGQVERSVRPAFERWFSDDGKWPAAAQRSGDGYALASAQAAWDAWQAASAYWTERVSLGADALRDHYAGQERPAQEHTLLFAALCDYKSAILGPNDRAEPPS